MRLSLDGSIRNFTLFEVIFRDVTLDRISWENSDSVESHLPGERPEHLLTNELWHRGLSNLDPKHGVWQTVFDNALDLENIGALRLGLSREVFLTFGFGGSLVFLDFTHKRCIIPE